MKGQLHHDGIIRELTKEEKALRGLNTKEGVMFGTVLVEVENQTHLTKVMRAMHRVKGVTSVDRREPASRASSDEQGM